MFESQTRFLILPLDEENELEGGSNVFRYGRVSFGQTVRENKFFQGGEKMEKKSIEMALAIVLSVATVLAFTGCGGCDGRGGGPSQQPPWAKSYGSTTGYVVRQTSDGGYIVAGAAIKC